MPITFGCPSCQKMLRVGNELAGQACRCPNCLSVLEVPIGAGHVEAAELPQAVLEPPPSPLPDGAAKAHRHRQFRRKGSSAHSRLGFWLGLGCSAIMLLALGVGIYFIFLSGTAIEEEIAYFPEEFDSVYSVNLDAIRNSGVYQKVSKELPHFLEQEFEEELVEPFGLDIDAISRVTVAGRGGELVRVFRLKRRFAPEELQEMSKEVRYRKADINGRIFYIPEGIGIRDGFCVEGSLLVVARTELLRHILERNGLPRFRSGMSRAMRNADFRQGEAGVQHLAVDAGPAWFRRRQAEADAFYIAVARYQSDEILVDFSCRWPSAEAARKFRDLCDEEIRSKAHLGVRERIEAERFSLTVSGAKVAGKAAFSVKDIIDMNQ